MTFSCLVVWRDSDSDGECGEEGGREQCSVVDASREKWAAPEAVPSFLGAFSLSGIFLDCLKR